MPTSQLVDDVRACLKGLDRLPTGRERALLVAAIARTDGTGRDVVDELQAARTALADWPLDTGDRGVWPEVTHLLRAVDAVLDPVPDVDLRTDRAPIPRGPLVEERTYRRDTDG